MSTNSRMIKYFWGDKGDLERFIGWEEIKNDFPEIVKAWDDYKMSRRILDILVANLED